MGRKTDGKVMGRMYICIFSDVRGNRGEEIKDVGGVIEHGSTWVRGGSVRSCARGDCMGEVMQGDQLAAGWDTAYCL